MSERDDERPVYPDDDPENADWAKEMARRIQQREREKREHEQKREG